MIIHQVDLAPLTKEGRVRNLSGRIRGLAARVALGIDGHDSDEAIHEIIIPDFIYAVTPSFIQGMLGDSFAALDSNLEMFRHRYRFVASPSVLSQVEKGIDAIATDRDLSLVH
ncbi:hypothetical protein [Sphingomicrobium flavum]|uniref:hypothetical protein n=1 Tax=Sphingomicrobium flavum TaxID=1229164 RepID=UPI0021ADBAEA|nr:hypothetical protein [Sphingomicrobium flavum]